MTRLTLIVVLVLALPQALPADVEGGQLPDPQRPPCTATTEAPIAICFPERALIVDHCSAQIVPVFDLDIWHPAETPTVGYRYSYQLVVDGADGRIEAVPPATTAGFPFTGSPDLSRLRLPFQGRARYSLRVTVTAENQRTFSLASMAVVLDDRPRIGGLVVGVSTYDNRSYDLNYPADDALAFHTAFNRLLNGQAKVSLDLRTTTNGKDLSKDGLLRAINDVVAEPLPDASSEDVEKWKSSQLCGDNDWYVFYYSGHGIVGVNRNGVVGRYVSTPAFNPAQLTRTSIRVTELATALFGTSVKNILIVLDSCFSGSHRHAMPARAPDGRGGRAIGDPQRDAEPHSPKVMYVSDGVVKDSPVAGEGDTKVFSERVREFDLNNGRAIVLAAASADREAEEGPVKYVQQNGATVLQFERGSVAANKSKPGHGLFTFTLLARLLSQAPAGMDLSDILMGGLPAIGRTCMLQFNSAGVLATADIEGLALANGWDLQKPELMVETIPPPLPCGAGDD